MTELQIGLIGLGGAAVVAVFGYNKWQEMRQRKLAEAVMKPQHDDVLLERREKMPEEAPVVRSEPVFEPEVAAPVAERMEPVLAEPIDDEPLELNEPIYAEEPDVQVAPGEETPMPAEVPPMAAPAVAPMPAPAKPQARQAEPAAAEGDGWESAGEVPAELLDPRLEYVVTMELVEPVSVVQILHSQRDALQRLHKPVHWVGFNERSREWERLSADNDIAVRRLRIGLQLVNRMGPVSEGDLTVFVTAMHDLADELMAVADMPPSRVLDQAAEIDRFCAAVDLEIGINLVSRGNAFAGTKIRALAEAAGMVLGGDGAFTRYDDEGRAQFSLQNYESTLFAPDALRSLSTHGLTFLLDVPRVDHGERVFMQMTEIARRFAETLQAAIVDDNRQPLTEPQLDHIRREFIGKPQATMAGFGLPAGSAQALRLFS